MSLRPIPQPRVSARLRLALSYAIFLVAAGAVCLFGVYLVLRYVPDYPLTAANPRDSGGSSVASRGEILDAVVSVSAGTLAALAVIGVSGGWFLAGWILKPLRQINEAAQIVATGDLHHRIQLAGRNDEFRQLADSFDHMLDRLQDAFAIQERFAANASHELRTPLAVTSTLLEVALRDPDGQDYPVLLERLSLTNDRAVGLTEALLRLADANLITAVVQPLDLAEVVRAVVKESGAEAKERGVTLTTQLSPAPISGDPALFTQLATNLLHNAIRHSEAPGNARISTSQDPARGTVTLRTVNGGARYTREAAARLVEPFMRGTGRVRSQDQHRSYGLGLALVARITAVHDGSIEITPLPDGGLDIAVTLPRRVSRPPTRLGFPAPSRPRSPGYADSWTRPSGA